MLRATEAGRRVIGAENRGGVSRGHSRWEAGKAIEALQSRKMQPRICESPNAVHRRPERFPERGLKEWRSRLPRNCGIASDESTGRKPGGWDEAVVGAARRDAPVGAHGRYAVCFDPICRTAGYGTRTSGGAGEGSREAPPYPESASPRALSASFDVATALPYIRPRVHGHRNSYVRPPRQRLLER